MPSGAQTERRGKAGPGRDLLDGETSPAACFLHLKSHQWMDRTTALTAKCCRWFPRRLPLQTRHRLPWEALRLSDRKPAGSDLASLARQREPPVQGLAQLAELVVSYLAGWTP